MTMSASSEKKPNLCPKCGSAMAYRRYLNNTILQCRVCRHYSNVDLKEK